ncbi:MAG: hypothetical protein ACRDIW_02025 [Actinomycetota bacterium]
MAEVAPDRDGLRLDQVPLRVGPFLPPLPPGFVMELRLQGDVVQEAAVAPNAFAAGPGASGLGARFARALTEPVPIAALEVARTRSHLRWAADGLVALGLDALGQRVLRLAGSVGPGDGGDVDRLGGLLRRAQVLGWATAGVGVIDERVLAGLGAGPVARASGLAEDLRSDDAEYRSLGFEPVVGRGGDARARWEQRLGEASQALALAERAGDRLWQPRGSVEAPRGRLDAASSPTGRLLELVPGVVEGLEWVTR